MERNLLTIAIPCFNEGENIEKVLEDIESEVCKLNIKVEVLVVDDGSKDSTYEVAEKVSKKYSNIKIIRHSVNQGFGAAFWTGVRHASSEYIVMIPGDGECNVEDALYGILIANNVDIIIPFVYNKINRTLSRRIISYVYTAIINSFFGTRLNYTNGTVIYRTSLLKKINLKSKGFFYQTELLMILIKSGYLYAEIPVFLLKRSGGVSTALSPKSLFRVIMDFLRIYFGVIVFKNMLIPIDRFSVTRKKIDSFNAE
jgi:glycosyltransferase involved in cell wall biosynthesis